MNATEREDLRRAVVDLLVALDSGDADSVAVRLGALRPFADRRMLGDLAEIAGHLQGGLRSLALDGPLVQAADRDLPDACSRLDAVVRTSEDAALRTLDLVDACRDEIDALDPALPAVPRLRDHLRGMAEAQAYQDLTGQTILKVIEVVRETEKALLALLRHAGVGLPDAAATSDTSDPLRGQGPRVAGVDGAGATQQDADQWLSDLGL